MVAYNHPGEKVLSEKHSTHFHTFFYNNLCTILETFLLQTDQKITHKIGFLILKISLRVKQEVKKDPCSRTTHFCTLKILTAHQPW